MSRSERLGNALASDRSVVIQFWGWTALVAYDLWRDRPVWALGHAMIVGVSGTTLLMRRDLRRKRGERE